jgi:glycerol-3-phosphate dehydrogenase subunit C
VPPPFHESHLDEASVRAETWRTFETCGGCRRCVDLCDAFPTLFELIDRRPGGDAGEMTPAEQDAVVDACVHCGECRAGCPYAAGVHERAIDVPAVAASNLAMRRATGQLGWRRRLTPWLVGRRRRRFSVSLGRHRPAEVTTTSVVVLACCSVELGHDQAAFDAVGQLARRQIGCVPSAAGCCGAPWLRAGDLAGFRRRAERAVATLAAEGGPDDAIVVFDRVCASLIRHQYPRHVPGEVSTSVALRVIAGEHVLARHDPDEQG